jgi:uncharacterized protein YjbJ (UPF0337 family)
MSNSGNEDRVDGKAKEASGKVQQAVGDLTDDAKLKAKGKHKEAEGKGQNLGGKIKNKVEDTVDATKDKIDEVTHKDHAHTDTDKH